MTVLSEARLRLRNLPSDPKGALSLLRLHLYDQVTDPFGNPVTDPDGNPVVQPSEDKGYMLLYFIDFPEILYCMRVSATLSMTGSVAGGHC